VLADEAPLADLRIRQAIAGEPRDLRLLMVQLLPRVDAAFADAYKIVEIEVTNNRLIPNAMEPRAAIGEYDAAGDVITLTTTSQNPHLIRLLLGAFVLGVPEHKLRVIAPDVSIEVIVACASVERTTAMKSIPESTRSST